MINNDSMNYLDFYDYWCPKQPFIQKKCLLSHFFDLFCITELILYNVHVPPVEKT